MFNEQIIKVVSTDTSFQEDILSWWRWRNNSIIPLESMFEKLFLKFPEFRTLSFYRIIKIAKVDKKLFPDIKKFPLRTECHITTDHIGGGLRIQHGSSTYINAERIGSNLHVNQNVTIGNYRGRPTIGNSVFIYPGAVVVGPINIGNNVVIAPNAYVNFDVPDNKKVFPARAIIK